MARYRCVDRQSGEELLPFQDGDTFHLLSCRLGPRDWSRLIFDSEPLDALFVIERMPDTEPYPIIVASDVRAERQLRVDLPKRVTVGGATFPLDTTNGGRANMSDLCVAAMAKQAVGNATTSVVRDADNVDRTLGNTKMIEAGPQIAA